MSPERLEIARRLVACPKWRWMPGMAVRYSHSGGGCGLQRRVVYVGGCLAGIIGVGLRIIDPSDLDLPGRSVSPADYIPDIDDDLTRLGLLAVVRLAHNDETAGVTLRNRDTVDPLWQWCAGFASGHASSEVAAMLSALEGAP